MNEKINTPPSERPTPITDDTERKARIGHQSLTDGQWPWLAISEGWNHARNLERQLAEVREQRDRLASAIRSFSTDFEEIRWGWDGDCGSDRLAERLLNEMTETMKGVTNEPR